MRWSAVAASVGMLLAITVAGAPPSLAAPPHALIQGTGSSWAANAVNQWVSDVQSRGLPVVYTGSGSAQGRKDFANGTTDFAVSDLAFRGVNAQTGESDTNCVQGKGCRAYNYAPLVAGGTSFPYQLKANGRSIDNLRLSGSSLAKIFTGTITRWDDPQITADNNGRVMPGIPIIPVVHSEGSGSSYYFSDYLAHEFPAQWSSFVGSSEPTEFWPSRGNAVAQSGSDGVMNFVSSAAANGAIGYDEYSYPLAKGFPVAKVLNRAGNFIAPEQYTVALALRQAKANPTGPADLAGVYADDDPRSYPLSYYSSMIIPTASNDVRMSTGKRQTLLDYLAYSGCQGQQEVGPLGYAPLPLNLTSALFDAAGTLSAADPAVDATDRDLAHCQNPTFTAGDEPADRLDTLVGQPPACDHSGQGPCGNDGNPAPTPTPTPTPRPVTALVLAGGTTIVSGAARTITGTLRSARGAVANTAVALFVATRSSGWRRTTTVRTDNRGTLRAVVRPAGTTRYQARFTGNVRYAAATSNAITIGVRHGVSATLSRRIVHVNRAVTITGTVRPGPSGGAVILQRRLGGQWRSIQATVTRYQHRADGRRVVGCTFRFVPRTHRTYVLRVVRPATPSNLVGTSATLRLRVR